MANLGRHRRWLRDAAKTRKPATSVVARLKGRIVEGHDSMFSPVLRYTGGSSGRLHWALISRSGSGIGILQGSLISIVGCKAHF